MQFQTQFSITSANGSRTCSDERLGCLGGSGSVDRRGQSGATAVGSKLMATDRGCGDSGRQWRGGDEAAGRNLFQVARLS
eukprot:156447-Alexandrium_andersonii.AAC.1